MNKRLVILIAERNPHIRKFIMRELLAEGYYVFSVETVSQLKKRIHLRRAVDILIIDPDLLDKEQQDLWTFLDETPEKTVIIHGLSTDQYNSNCIDRKAILVEKSASSIFFIKNRIRQLYNFTSDGEPIDP